MVYFRGAGRLMLFSQDRARLANELRSQMDMEKHSLLFEVRFQDAFNTSPVNSCSPVARMHHFKPGYSLVLTITQCSFVCKAKQSISDKRKLKITWIHTFPLLTCVVVISCSPWAHHTGRQAEAGHQSHACRQTKNKKNVSLPVAQCSELVARNEAAVGSSWACWVR